MYDMSSYESLPLEEGVLTGLNLRPLVRAVIIGRKVRSIAGALHHRSERRTYLLSQQCREIYTV